MSSETSALLLCHPPERHGTIRSSTFNLTASAIGAGVLVLPFSFKTSGCVLGLILLIVFGLVSLASFYFLEESCRKANKPIHSFEGIAEYYYGSWMKRVVQVSLMLLLFGALIIFLVLASDNILPVLQTWLFPSLSRNVLMMILALLILPLCLVDELHALRQTSLIILLCIGYVFLIIVVQFIYQAMHHQLPPIRYIQLDENTLYTFSVQSLAYCCQFNVLPLFAELRQPTRPRMNRIKNTTIGLCIIVYALFGLLGYWSFGDDTPGDILKAFNSANAFIAVGRVVLGISLLLKCPLVLHPLRLAIFHETDSASNAARKWHMFGSTLGLLLPATFGAIALPDIQRVYSALGGTAGGFICFILPSVIFLGTTGSSRKEKLAAYFIFVLGIISIFASLYITFFPPPFIQSKRRTNII